MVIAKQKELLFVIFLSFLSAQLFAVEFDNEFEEKPWKEVDEVQFPTFPRDENLIPFQVGAITDTRFFVDGNSISVGSDSVIRFALVVDSSAGARNISYEGMRCETAERRLYASGRSDSTWARARSNQWVRIKGGSNNHYAGLYANFFCTVGASPITEAEDVRKVLRSGGNSKGNGP